MKDNLATQPLENLLMFNYVYVLSRLKHCLISFYRLRIIISQKNLFLLPTLQRRNKKLNIFVIFYLHNIQSVVSVSVQLQSPSFDTYFRFIYDCSISRSSIIPVQLRRRFAFENLSLISSLTGLLFNIFVKFFCQRVKCSVKF